MPTPSTAPSNGTPAAAGATGGAGGNEGAGGYEGGEGGGVPAEGTDDDVSRRARGDTEGGGGDYQAAAAAPAAAADDGGGTYATPFATTEVAVAASALHRAEDLPESSSSSSDDGEGEEGCEQRKGKGKKYNNNNRRKGGGSASDGNADTTNQGGGGGGAAAAATGSRRRPIARGKRRPSRAAESSLLPPPPAVQHWLDGGSSSTPAGAPQYDLAQQATAWLVQAVQAAHVSPRIKQAGRALMACYNFTANLEYLKCWTQTLVPDLTAALVALGETAKQANAASNLTATLTAAAILAAAPYNLSELPDGHATPRARVRQDVLMPSLTAAVSTDYDRDWKAQPEHVYVHMLLLVGTAVNPLFGAALAAVASDLPDGIGIVEIHAAAIKSFTRMINKLRSADDHLHVKQKPRPAMNIDVVRRLAAAETAAGVIELIKQVAARFGGLSHLKCLPELAATD
eukprot:gene32643-biopygen12563